MVWTPDWLSSGLAGGPRATIRLSKCPVHSPKFGGNVLGPLSGCTLGEGVGGESCPSTLTRPLEPGTRAGSLPPPRCGEGFRVAGGEGGRAAGFGGLSGVELPERSGGFSSGATTTFFTSSPVPLAFFPPPGPFRLLLCCGGVRMRLGLGEIISNLELLLSLILRRRTALMPVLNASLRTVAG